VLTCDSVVANSPKNLNPSQFCDRSVDAKIDRAFGIQAINPEAARDLWETIDRETVDQAPWAPFINGRAFDVTSKWVGNYQFNPAWGALLDQLWLR
jgi:peptide/nickel transport system substrate-binding protein